MTFEEFKQMDLRIGKVIFAERISDSDKLLRLEVDLGDEQRQIVAGIAQQYTPQTLVGREIVVVVNLEPRTIRGVESRGMLLATSDAGDAPVLLSVEREVPPGARVT